MNQYLKEICELCGRKTFICFMLSIGIAPQVVMKFTGHADYKSYILVDFTKVGPEIPALFDDVSNLDRIFMALQFYLCRTQNQCGLSGGGARSGVR